MRISSRGIDPADDAIGLTFDGHPVLARRGDSLAAALVDAGELGCRETAGGDLRGVFCGMGVCQECLLVVDGVPGQRACMTAVRDGMSVERQPARVSLAEVAPLLSPPSSDERQLTADLVVVGGGPAGLAAAAIAAEAGLDVVLADERSRLGGQYFKQPAAADERVDETGLDAQFRAGRRLVERVRRAGVRVLGGVQVWGAFGAGDLRASGAGARWVLRPRRIVIAAGAYERGVPLPGWTLPGVMATGAAQTLLRAHQVAPGARVLVSGNGPLNMQVAAELVAGGAKVVALAELAPFTSARRASALMRMAAAAPDLIRDGARYQATLFRARVPVLAASVVVGCEGDEAVRRAVVARIGPDGRAVPGTERGYDVDAVCVGFGFLPSNELSRALGCRHRVDAARHELVVERDALGRTSVEHVWVVGDAGGIGGARLAQAAGARAGADVARSLGIPLPGRLREELRAAGRARRRALRFQAALGDLYAAPYLVDELAEDDTLICRCESISRGTVEAALDDELAHIGTLKRATRAGMGGCQGRYCASLLGEMAARRSGRALDERSGFAPSSPFRPTPIAVIAGRPGDP